MGAVVEQERRAHVLDGRFPLLQVDGGRVVDLDGAGLKLVDHRRLLAQLLGREDLHFHLAARIFPDQVGELLDAAAFHTGGRLLRALAPDDVGGRRYSWESHDYGRRKGDESTPITIIAHHSHDPPCFRCIAVFFSSRHGICPNRRGAVNREFRMVGRDDTTTAVEPFTIGSPSVLSFSENID